MGLRIRDLKTVAFHNAWVADCEATALSRTQLSALLSMPKATLDKTLEFDETRYRPHIYPYMDRIPRLVGLLPEGVRCQSLALLLRECGLLYVPVPTVSTGYPAELAGLVETHSRALTKMLRIYEDGSVDEGEAARCVPKALADCDELVAVIHSVKARLQRDAEEALHPSTLAAAERKANGQAANR